MSDKDKLEHRRSGVNETRNRDYYKKCVKCGYETGKSKCPKEGNMRCWKCGEFIYIDFRRNEMSEPQAYGQGAPFETLKEGILTHKLTIATDALKQYSERDNWSESLDSMPGVNNNTLQLEDIWGGNSSHGWSVARQALQQIKDQS